MLQFKEALEIVLNNIKELGYERVDIISAIGRVLFEDVYAKYNHPPSDNSAMDGFAVKYDDIKGASKENPVKLLVVAELPAGNIFERPFSSGEAVRIMTGSPIPYGADTVVMQEDTLFEKGEVLIYKKVDKGANIRKIGEDIKKGDKILNKGSILKPADIGIIATTGRSFVTVYQKPKVAIISTGDELCSIDEVPENFSKIIDSNSYAILAQVKETGANPLIIGIAKDNKEDLEEKFKLATKADVIISSGGISVGAYDYVKEVFENIGCKILFWKVAIKPGKPFAFGLIGDKPVFILPGNPVSSMLTFELFVRPSLLKIMGHKNIFRPVVEAISDSCAINKDGRMTFFRVVLHKSKEGYIASLTGEQGSGILKSMVDCHGLMILPSGKEEIKKGDKVKVIITDTNLIGTQDKLEI